MLLSRMASTPTLTTSQLANAADVGVETVRYYERRGLLPPPERDTRGHRRWSDEDRRRLLFIRRAQEHGFLLEEIRELLELRIDTSEVRADVARASDRVIQRIDRKIEELNAMRRALVPLRDACPGAGANGPCPILEALNDEAE